MEIPAYILSIQPTKGTPFNAFERHITNIELHNVPSIHICNIFPNCTNSKSVLAIEKTLGHNESTVD